MNPVRGLRALIIGLCALASFAPALHAQSALASPWSSEDIGSPAIAGTVSVSSGTYTIAAAGADIWGTADQFRFVYQPMTGDGEVVARVNSVTQANAWSKAGVMMRETLTSGSKHAYALVSAAKGVAFQQRISTGGSSTNIAGTLSAAPRWVRLVRTGSNFQAYESGDGQTWQSIGAVTISMASTIYVGLAVTSHNASATTTATVSNVVEQPATAAGGNVPAPWTSEDVGAPAVAGTASYDATASTFSAKGAGADIWGTADQFHFVHQLLTGDGEIVARVGSLAAINAWSKAGVMVREDLSAGAKHAFVLVSASKGVAFQRRTTTGGTSLNTAGDFVTSPYWVRLVRTGDQLAAYEAPDGGTWKLIGSETISMLQTVYVGLAVTSHDATTATTAAFTNVTVTQSGSTTNQPPTVTLTSPSAGAAFYAPNTISLTASASDPNGTIASVSFYAGSTLIGTDTTAPYAINWSNTAAGTYSLTAVATDNSGASTRSAAVSVVFNPTLASFTPSVDDATLVSSYRLDIFPSSADPNTATPVATQSLGKPTPVNGVDTVDITAALVPLAPGTYLATISAIGSSGSSRSATVSFVR